MKEFVGVQLNFHHSNQFIVKPIKPISRICIPILVIVLIYGDLIIIINHDDHQQQQQPSKCFWEVTQEHH